MKVLIVEDSESKQKSVIRILEKNKIMDYCVKASIEEAIEAVIYTKFDLLITDLGLPQSSDHSKVNSTGGFNLILKFVDKNIRIPTIIYSTMLLSKKNVHVLTQLNYPLIAQVMDSAVIEVWLKKLYLTKT